MITTTRQCEGCGLTLVRRHYPDGQLEHAARFAARRTCGRACGLPRTPKPVTMSFAASYRDALAQGVDFLETFDAAWEA